MKAVRVETRVRSSLGKNTLLTGAAPQTFPNQTTLIRSGMAKKVVGIHLVCRKGLNVEDLGNGYFKSGHWKISESRARTAQYLALHESKNQPSYRQGRIENWEPSEERPGRIIFFVKATDEANEWMGNGAGEKGYLWSDEQPD